jgi:hypothetical protein
MRTGPRIAAQSEAFPFLVLEAVRDRRPPADGGAADRSRRRPGSPADVRWKEAAA